MIVQIAGCGIHAEFFCKYSPAQFLCGSLAIRTGYSQDGYTHLFPVVGCQLLQGGKHIINPVNARMKCGCFFIHNGGQCTLFNCLECELVAVKVLPFQPKKNTAGRYFPGINGYQPVLQV